MAHILLKHLHSMAWCDDYMGNIWSLVDKSEHPTFYFRGGRVGRREIRQGVIWGRNKKGAGLWWIRSGKNDEHMQTLKPKVKKKTKNKGHHDLIFLRAPISVTRLLGRQSCNFCSEILFVLYNILFSKRKKKHLKTTQA